MKSHSQRQLVWFLVGLLFGILLVWNFSKYAVFVMVLVLVALGVMAAIKYQLWQRIQNARSNRTIPGSNHRAAPEETPPLRTRGGQHNRYQ